VPQEPNRTDPDWLADGNSLIFRDVWRSPDAITGIHLLDLRTHQISILPRSEGLWAPRVSPDGRHVVSLNRDATRLVLMDLTTHRIADLVSGANVGWPEWSHDSKSVIFVLGERPNSSPGIFRVRIADRKLEEILSLKDVPLRVGLFGAWYGLTPDDSPLMLRDAASQEVYALDVQLP